MHNFIHCKKHSFIKTITLTKSNRSTINTFLHLFVTTTYFKEIQIASKVEDKNQSVKIH